MINAKEIYTFHKHLCKVHFFNRTRHENYEGHSRISDKESISEKILIESELLVTENMDIGVAYSCLKYGVFITTGAS